MTGLNLASRKSNLQKSSLVAILEVDAIDRCLSLANVASWRGVEVLRMQADDEGTDDNAIHYAMQLHSLSRASPCCSGRRQSAECDTGRRG